MALLALVDIAIHWEALVTFGVLEMMAEKGMLMMEEHFACRALRWPLSYMDIWMSHRILLQAEALPTFRT